MSIHLDTSSVHRLAADLEAAPARQAPRLAGAVRQAARGVERDAQAFAPVRTGALKESIRAVAVGDHAEIVADVRYSAYVEEGTSDTAPQPFMRPAFERNLSRFERAVLDIGGDFL